MTKAKLTQLYQWCLQVEVDLRYLKTTLGMEILPGKTLQMLPQEIYVHLSAYNLRTTVSSQANKLEFFPCGFLCKVLVSI